MENKKFAVLIDADNISRTKIRYILDEIARWGSPVIKRAYGDWTSPSMSAWKSVLLDNSVIPVQQYAYTTGKNATDSALIIDAMDILHRENVDGFASYRATATLHGYRAVSANRAAKYWDLANGRPLRRLSSRATVSSLWKSSAKTKNRLPPRLPR